MQVDVDKWPASKQIYLFYLVKYLSHDGSKLNRKIGQADADLKMSSEKRFKTIESLKEKGVCHTPFDLP